jgi:hypothetical protein
MRARDEIEASRRDSENLGGGAERRGIGRMGQSSTATLSPLLPQQRKPPAGFLLITAARIEPA